MTDKNTPLDPADAARWEWVARGLIAATMLLPAARLRPGWPEVRVEQVVALVALGWMLRLWWRAARPLNPLALDWLFVAVVVSTLASAVYAPLVYDTRFSPRDLFEAVKVVMYWALFRASWTVVRRQPRAALDGMQTLLACGALIGAFGLAQYYDVLAVNDWLTPRFAPPHHLRTLAEDARAVGTVGNPNYYGVLSAVVALAAVAWRALVGDRRDRWLADAAMVGGVTGLVTSAARGAALGWLVGMAVMVGAAVVWRRGIARPLIVGIARAIGVTVVVIAIVEIAPRGRTPYLTRLTSSIGAQSDGSLALRIERWRALLPWRGDPSPAADAAAFAPRGRVGVTGVPPATGAAQAGDARRKADLATIAVALTRYQAERGIYPHDLAVLAAGGYLDALPTDPAGGDYTYQTVGVGFALSAALEDPADPDYPLITVGTAANHLQNGSFEDGGAEPRGYRLLAGTRAVTTTGDALFGEQSLRFLGNPEQPQGRTAIFQQRYLGRTRGAPLTAVLWVKLPQPLAGDLWLWTNVYYADGSRADPATAVPVDGSRIGVWQRLVAPITPDPLKRITFVGVYLLGEDFRGEALADGFTLVDGTLPPSFATLREAPPAAGAGTESRLRTSPLLGVGPEKAEGAGTIDNEYLTVALRYGVVGLAAYLALWAGVAVGGYRALRSGVGGAALAFGLLTLGSVTLLLTFALVAGPFLHLQLMAVWWLLVGAMQGLGMDGILDGPSPPAPLPTHRERGA